MGKIYEQIVEMFKEYPEVLYGFSDIAFSDYCEQYTGALIFAVPHSKIMTLDDYSEPGFNALMSELKDKAHEIRQRIKAILDAENSAYLVPPPGQSDESALLAPFSFKRAAVTAGLGWVGKNAVLITPTYGPRVRLSAILINFDFPKAEPITQSSCPEECFICVSKCPHKALKGKQWDIHTDREQIIDYHRCNERRSQYIKTHNRKNACGICMISCPIGCSI